MDASDLLKVRKDKIEALAASGVEAYPNDAKVTHLSAQLHEVYGQMDNEALEGVTERFAVAGRVMATRNFGKGAFVALQDPKGRTQAFTRQDKPGH